MPSSPLSGFTSVLLLSTALLVFGTPTRTLVERQGGRPIDTWRPSYPHFDKDHSYCINSTVTDATNAWARSPLQTPNAPPPANGGIAIPTILPTATGPPCSLIAWQTYRIPSTGALEVDGYDENTQTLALGPGTYTMTWDPSPGGLESSGRVWEIKVYYASPGKDDYKVGAHYQYPEDQVFEGPKGEITFMVVGTAVKYVHFLIMFTAPSPYGVIAIWNVPSNTLANPKSIFPR